MARSNSPISTRCACSVVKMSIANAIADVLGLPLVSLDMSTISDPEGLVGSSRIYSNAKPGIIMEKLIAARDVNCMFLINELDKAATESHKGNPADVLLTLVDKMGFQDTFMEALIDTRNAFFIATCNDVEKIRPILPPITNQSIIGCATFIAIMSAAAGKAISSGNVFIGGCDIYGNLSWDSQLIDPVVELAERSGLTHMYGPIGLGAHSSGSSQVQIIGSYNAGLLFEII